MNIKIDLFPVFSIAATLENRLIPQFPGIVEPNLKPTSLEENNLGEIFISLYRFPF